jgi:DNA-binding GntR family transcriptional regulator
MRQLLDALVHGSMGPGAAARLLGISHTAARNYLDALVQGGVAHYDPVRGTHVCPHPDHAVRQRFLNALEEGAEGRVTLRRSATRHCMNPGQSFLHVLADDVGFPLTTRHQPPRRDPLVAALFGA